MPGQNLLVAEAGHIGWTIAGRLPVRGDAPGLPQLSTDAAVGCTVAGPEEQPRVIDPAGGLLWSANARVVGGAAGDLIGDDGMDRGARAAQILADLKGGPRPFTPAASLAVQLDDRALFLERWRSLMGEVIEHARASGDHAHDAARAVLATWSGHAAPGDAAYRLVQRFVPKSKRARISCSLRRHAGRRRTSASKSRRPSKVPCGAWCSSVPRICSRRIIPTGMPSSSRPSSRVRNCRRRAAASPRAPGATERACGSDILSRRRSRCSLRFSTCRR